MEPVTDEAVGGGEMLEQIFVVDIVDLDDHVRKGGEQVSVQRGAQDGQDVGNVGLLQGFASPQREHATQLVRQSPDDRPGRSHGGYLQTMAADITYPPIYRLRSPGTRSMRAMMPLLVLVLVLVPGRGVARRWSEAGDEGMWISRLALATRRAAQVPVGEGGGGGGGGGGAWEMGMAMAMAMAKGAAAGASF